MESLVKEIEALKKEEIGRKISARINEFKRINRNSSEDLFKELCYCILAARFSAKKCYNMCNEIGDKFLTNSPKKIKNELDRFYYPLASQRAKYISKAFRKKDQLKKAIKSLEENELRDWIKNNIKGVGYKVASHFLRNIGFDDYAIIDTHIIDLLIEKKLISEPKNPYGKTSYQKIENELKAIAEKVNLSLGELDLYLWYLARYQEIQTILK
jgi:N-glycosylase/DNA lyase